MKDIQLPDQKPPIRQLTRWLAVLPPVLSVLWVIVSISFPEIAERARRAGVLDLINNLLTIFGGSPVAWVVMEKFKDAKTLSALFSQAPSPVEIVSPISISPTSPPTQLSLGATESTTSPSAPESNSPLDPDDDPDDEYHYSDMNAAG